MTTLIIARHGNTFGPDDTVTYVGARTDLPLVDSGREQAKKIGQWLKEHNKIPDVIYASQLQRAQETAKIAIKESGVPNPVYTLDIFNEIDYGPDENKTKEEVFARIGEKAHKDWEERSIIPDGWKVEKTQIIQNWIKFAEQISAHDDNETVLVVTSNGIARFAPHITGDYESFAASHKPKMATGGLSVLTCQGNRWEIKDWNIKP